MAVTCRRFLKEDVPLRAQGGALVPRGVDLLLGSCEACLERLELGPELIDRRGVIAHHDPPNAPCPPVTDVPPLG